MIGVTGFVLEGRGRRWSGRGRNKEDVKSLKPAIHERAWFHTRSQTQNKATVPPSSPHQQIYRLKAGGIPTSPASLEKAHSQDQGRSPVLLITSSRYRSFARLGPERSAHNRPYLNDGLG